MENKLKKYTLTDLKEKKIAVRIAKKDNFIKICNLLGYIPNSGDYSFIEYHGVDEDNEFVWLNDEDLEGRILLKSIDEIDLEEKEDERKTINKVAELIGEASMCWSETPKGIFDSTRASEIVDKIEAVYNSEITRLKEENQQLRESTQISQSQQSERTRMAWEALLSIINANPEQLHGNVGLVACDTAINLSYEYVDSFLAKSKEVGNGN